MSDQLGRSDGKDVCLEIIVLSPACALYSAPRIRRYENRVNWAGRVGAADRAEAVCVAERPARARDELDNEAALASGSDELGERAARDTPMGRARSVNPYRSFSSAILA